MIEFTAADSKADGVVINGFDFPFATQQARAESGDRLKGPSAAIVVNIDAGVHQQLGRDPSGADLVARKRRPIHDHDVQTHLAELPRTRRSGRPSADDEHVTRVHIYRVYPLTRVQGIPLLLPRVNTTW